MTKSLAKVQKKISKKGHSTSLHENSKNAQRLRRAYARTEKLHKQSTERAKANQYYIERTTFFQEAAKTSTGVFSSKEPHNLVQGHLKRHDDEIANLQRERRPGRPPNPREGALKDLVDREDREFAAGFWMPDLEDEESLRLLRAWNGQWTSLSSLKYVRLTRDGIVNPSSFPPKGKS